MKSSSTIPLAIIFGGIIVAIAVYVSIPKRPVTITDKSSLVRPVGASDHIFGNPAAKVVIVEYSDFDCEYCKNFHETLHQIIANEGANGQVAWVFRQFPLLEIHPNTLSHARATECIAETAGNSAFWTFADALFKSQPVDSSQYGTLARTAGISGDAFARCYASPPATITERIMADRQNALDIGAQGTPYSVIIVAGKPATVINGIYSYIEMKQLIDQALAQ